MAGGIAQLAQWLAGAVAPSQDSCSATDVSVLCVHFAAFATQVVSWAVKGGHCAWQPPGTGQRNQHHLSQPLNCPAQAPHFVLPDALCLPFCQVLVLPGALGGALVMVFLRWS